MGDTCWSHVLGVCGMPVCPVPSLTTPYLYQLGSNLVVFSQQKGAQDACGVHQGRRRAPKLSQYVLYGSAMHWAGRCSLELHTVQDETTNSSIISVKYGVRAAPKLATVCFKQSEGCQCVANAGATC